MPVGYVPPLGVHEWNRSQSGMSLRDYFAAKAMAALIAEPPWTPGSTPFLDKVLGNEPYTKPAKDNLAAAAYLVADAMLAAREAKQP